MQTDAAEFIGHEVKSIMELVTDIDVDLPDEDIVEVLIGAFDTWGTIQVQVLFPALEAIFEDSEPAMDAARKRLNILRGFEEAIHTGEGVESPFAELAKQYVEAVKYHLVVDVQEMLPLTAQLPDSLSAELAASMLAMKRELE